MKQSVIVFGRYEGVEKAALEFLSKSLLDATGDYPSCIPHSEYSPQEGCRYFFIGTKESNPLLSSGTALTRPEEYRIRVHGDNAFIEGFDPAGVLYGCVDFYAKYISMQELTHDSGNYFRNIFETALPDAEICSAPSVSRRGLWTWGHVLYDYRGYFDNMARLKMNTVIIWNDHVPMNAADMVEYAHERNVQVIWGFSWLWDTNCLEAGLDRLEEASDEIVRFYETHYANLQGDGIYFQSFTELHQETIGGVLIADAVTSFVNNTSAKLLAKYPGLELQFGLHATSVREKLDYIRRTDPRVHIVWEDCGAFPFDYLPDEVGSFDETKELVSEIAVLRGEEERFGVVLKGMTKLDWSAFRHPHGRSHLAVSSKQMQQNRLERKRRIWHYLQAGWLANGDKALEMIRLMQQKTNGNLVVTALVEDGMFETKLYYPAALLGEMLWNCDADIRELSYAVSLRSDVEFA